MKLLSLVLIFVSFNAQASLYCALGEKTPSEHISTLPYATLQIDALDANQIQAYVTDYYNEINYNTILKFSGTSISQINNIEIGVYLNENGEEAAVLEYQNEKIIFVLNKKSFTCEIL